MTTVLLLDRRGRPSRRPFVVLLEQLGCFLLRRDRKGLVGLRRKGEGSQHSITAKTNGPLATAGLYEGCMLRWSRYTNSILYLGRVSANGVTFNIAPHPDWVLNRERKHTSGVVCRDPISNATSRELQSFGIVTTTIPSTVCVNRFNRLSGRT